MTRSSNRLRKTFSPQNQKKIENALLRAGKFKTEVETILEPYKIRRTRIDDREKLENLFIRFHSVAIQLKRRQRNRDPFIIKDEYDVQDLLHALLKIDFKDVIAEEYCPSYAGVSPRMDFFLRGAQIAVEAKITRKGHGNKKISHELIIDKEYYRKKTGVNTLYCFVYDPKEIIENPDGFEKDLFEKSENFEAKTFVVPRR